MDHLPTSVDVAVSGGAFGHALAAAFARAQPDQPVLYLVDSDQAVADIREKGFAEHRFAKQLDAAGAGRVGLAEALRFPGNVIPTTHAAYAANGSQIQRLYVPAYKTVGLRERVGTEHGRYADLLGSECGVLSVAKGMEAGTHALPHEILKSIFGSRREVGVLLGGNLALDLAVGNPMIAEVAGSKKLTKDVQNLLDGSGMRVYRSRDVRKLDIAGPVKNVHAVFAGMVHALKQGASAEAAVTTRALAECERIAYALKFRFQFLQSAAGKLAGLRHRRGSDLRSMSVGRGVVNDYVLSVQHGATRNYAAGVKITELMQAGMSAQDAILVVSREDTVEGIDAVFPLTEFINRIGIPAPLIDILSKVLSDQMTLEEAKQFLMARPTR